MTIRTGHANSAEKAHIASLEEKLRSGSLRPDERLDLALVNLEPLHDGFRAAELLRELLAENPGHEIAKLWLAHVYIFAVMDETALNEAVRLCEELLAASERPETGAAAHLLKADALRQLGDRDPVPELRQSVALAPTWVGTGCFSPRSMRSAVISRPHGTNSARRSRRLGRGRLQPTSPAACSRC